MKKLASSKIMSRKRRVTDKLRGFHFPRRFLSYGVSSRLIVDLYFVALYFYYLALLHTVSGCVGHLSTQTKDLTFTFVSLINNI